MAENAEKPKGPWAELEFSCEDGCEFFITYETGHSIYGPDVVEECGHPDNESGSCRKCPRKEMSTEDLIHDMLDTIRNQGNALASIISIVQQAEDCLKARERGRPYDNDPFKTPQEILAKLRRAIDLYQKGEEICDRCGTIFPKGENHDCKRGN